MFRHALIAIALLLACSTADAQRSVYQQQQDWNRIINNRIQNDMTLQNMCEEWRRKGETVPEDCGESSGPAAGTATPAVSAADLAALDFTPHAGDSSVQDFANQLGKNATERQQLVLAITAVKRDVLERDYGAKGWTNNVAGAYAFLIGSLHMAWSGNEPSTAQTDALFASLSTTMAPSLVGVSDQEKTALYNTLIASATLPLLLHLDGKDKNDPAELEQARELAAHYSRTMLKMEPQALAGVMQPAGNATAPGATGAWAGGE